MPCLDSVKESNVYSVWRQTSSARFGGAEFNVDFDPVVHFRFSKPRDLFSDAEL